MSGEQRSGGRGQGTDGGEVVGVEDFQAFEEVTQSPGDGREFAGDGRGEGDLAEFAAAVGKQLFDLRRADAARLRVDGVEPEVIGEDEAGGFEDAQQVAADAAPQVGVQNGGEGRELQEHVEGARREGQAASVRVDEAAAGQAFAGGGKPVEKQVHAKQVGGTRPEGEELRQHAPAAAAHFEDAQAGEVGQSQPTQGVHHRPLAGLDGKQVGVIEGGVIVAAREAPGAVGIFRAEAGEVIRLVHWRIEAPGRFCRSSGSRISGGRPGSRVRKPGEEWQRRPGAGGGISSRVLRPSQARRAGWRTNRAAE